MSKLLQEAGKAAPGSLPRHLAVVMDGNGRWAARRGLPRFAGHQAGVRALRELVRHHLELGIPCLTVFVFSSENWQRPRPEVRGLFCLLEYVLSNGDLGELHREGVCLRFIGLRDSLSDSMRRKMEHAERMTAVNTRLRFLVAVNYGGRWDIVRACRSLAGQVRDGHLGVEALNEERLDSELSLAGLQEPDLLVRTGGERRLSNYLLWHLAYTELYFTDCLWPDFDGAELEQALAWFAGRRRRFGRTDGQLTGASEL